MGNSGWHFPLACGLCALCGLTLWKQGQFPLSLARQWGVMGRKEHGIVGSDRLGFKSQLHHLLAVWSWGSDLTSLSSSKEGIIIILHHMDLLREGCVQCQALQKPRRHGSLSHPTLQGHSLRPSADLGPRAKGQTLTSSGSWPVCSPSPQPTRAPV